MSDSKYYLFYIGTDNFFFDLVQKAFQRYFPTFEAEYRIYDLNKNEISYILKKIYRKKPLCLYFDFSDNYAKLTQLYHLVKMEPSLQKISSVFLTEAKDNASKLALLYSEFVYVKGAEIYSTVFSAFYQAMLKDKKDSSSPFAVAQSRQETILFEPVYLSSISEDFLNIQCNNLLVDGSKVVLHNNISKKSIPSTHFIVQKEENSEGEHLHEYRLQFMFADHPTIAPIAEDASDEEKATHRAQVEMEELKYQDRLIFAKYKNKKWVKNNSNNQKVVAKILIIDPQLTLYSQLSTLLKDFNLSFQIVSGLSEDQREITKFKPHLIIYHFTPATQLLETEEIKVEEEDVAAQLLLQNKKQLLQEMYQLKKQIVSWQRTPILLINSLNIQLAFLKKFLQYDNLFTSNQFFDYKVIQKLIAKIINKNKVVKHNKIVYLERKDDLAFASLEHQITIISISENDLIFTSAQELFMGNYFLKHPLPIFLKLVPSEGSDFHLTNNLYTYRAIIHGVDENSKKALRRLVYSIFCKEKKEKEEEEQKNFDTLNAKVQNEKILLAQKKLAEENRKKEESIDDDLELNKREDEGGENSSEGVDKEQETKEGNDNKEEKIDIVAEQAEKKVVNF